MPPKGKDKGPKHEKAQNDESEKDKQIKALLLRVDCLEKNMDLKVFQKSSGSNTVVEYQLALWQEAFKSAEKELIMLKQGLPLSGDGNVPGSPDEPRRLTDTIATLHIEITKKNMEIADITTKLSEAESALSEMTKQLSDNRHSQESPRNTSAKSQPSDGNTPAKLAALETPIQPVDGITPAKLAEFETSIQSKDSEIKILKGKITQLESTASRDSQSNAKLQEEMRKKNESIAQLNKELQLIRQPTDGNTSATLAEIEASMQSKESEIKSLKEKNARLESAAIIDKQSNAQLQEAILKKDQSSIEKLNEELQSIRNELEEKGSEIKRVQEEKKSQLQRLQEENDAALKRLKEQKDNEERSKQMWMDKVKDLENNTERSKSAKARSDSLQTLLKEKETEIRSKTGEIESLQQEMAGLKKSYNVALTNCKTLEGKIKATEEDYKKKLVKKDETIRGEKTMEKTAPSGRDDVGVLKQQLTQATLEIDELKSRLSKMVGENLTNNNPNITDLSDENRPTKLAEIYSEMYDNEWTDSFEELEKQGLKEPAIIPKLLTILQDTVKFCGNMAKQYIEHLQNSASKLQETTSTENKFQKLHLLKELRKSYAPSLAEEVFSLYVQKENLKFAKTPKVEAYTKSCIKLCWLMSVQDPAVVIDEVKTPSKFDGDRYRTYTKSGTTIDFVVWPTMLLHAGGPILMKGVAQCK